MNRSLSIICHLFLICVLYTPVWGQTNLEQCVKSGNEKDYTAAYPACQKAAEEGVRSPKAISLRCSILVREWNKTTQRLHIGSVRLRSREMQQHSTSLPKCTITVKG